MAILDAAGGLRRWRAQRHLKSCPSCQAEFAGFQILYARAAEAMRERELNSAAMERGREALCAVMQTAAGDRRRTKLIQEILGERTLAQAEIPDARLNEVLRTLAGSKAASAIRSR